MTKGLIARRDRTSPYAVQAFARWSDAEAVWRTLEQAANLTPFQTATWLGAWYGALARDREREPLIVVVRDAATGQIAIALPLVTMRVGGCRVLSFADCDLTDYNAPVLGPAAPVDRAEARALWRALRAQLNADLLDIRKMPRAIAGAPNPLALLAGVTSCPLNGNLIEVPRDWDAFHRGLEKPVRKELERSWRVFTKADEARFLRVDSAAQGIALLDVMERQQAERMAEIGNDYVLDRPENRNFYRRLVAEHLDDRFAVMTALMSKDEVVAGLLAIRRDDLCIMIRLTHAGRRWANCSPGRLLLHKTMAHLHAEGTRAFDFSIGNYAYKRRFGTEPIALTDLVLPLSWRGVPSFAKARVTASLRASPAADRAVRRLLGKKDHAKEASEIHGR